MVTDYVCLPSLVTVFPDEPLKGAHEIQRFCLGHTEFVTCIPLSGIQSLLKGISCLQVEIQLFDITSGSLLDTCEVSTMAGHLESNESEAVQVTVTLIYAISQILVLQLCLFKAFKE